MAEARNRGYGRMCVFISSQCSRSEPDHDLSDWDILFADDEREANPATFKFIQNALAWRSKGSGGQRGGMLAELLAQEEESDEDEDGDGDGDGDGDEDGEKSSNGGDRMQD
jgi:crooked neck